MWVIHACLANLTVNCEPRDNAELFEYLGLIFVSVLGIAVFFALLLLAGEWLG